MSLSSFSYTLNGQITHIHIGESLLTTTLIDLTELITGPQCLIVTDNTVADCHLPSAKRLLSSFQVDTLILPSGERHKTLSTVERIWNHLIDHHHHRDTTLIALGGGVIGDMTGLAAALYLRGVPFIQIPTTLLAQTDAAIGGKTAVDHPRGKNLIGAFHQPKEILIDISTLDTLPERHFNAGMAEVIKTAAIHSSEFFTWLENEAVSILNRTPKTLATMIEQCARIKASIVEKDEKEQGIRAHLNFGHTFGHAIEHTMNYEGWLHGEAVAVGMLMACELSQEQGDLSEEASNRITSLLHRFQLVQHLPADLNENALLASMQQDKKMLNHRLRVILLKRIGEAYITDTINPSQILNLFKKHKTG